jgi:hypothetical protein
VTVLLVSGSSGLQSIEETFWVHFWSQYVSMPALLTVPSSGSSLIVLSGFLEIPGVIKLKSDIGMSSALVIVIIFVEISYFLYLNPCLFCMLSLHECFFLAKQHKKVPALEK